MVIRTGVSTTGKGNADMQADSMLRVDEERTVRQLESYVHEVTSSNGARGVLMGLSGGVDSALLATVIARALGTKAVHVLFLGDRDSDKDSMHKARLVADWLGLTLESQDISDEMRKRGVYASPIVRVMSLSGLANRFLCRVYQLMYRETCFMSTLREGRGPRQAGGKRLYDLTVGKVETAFNARHMYRREVIESRARIDNLLPLGAANRTEFLTGWFVKGGIDDLPLQPLMGLYKTQVRQLASYLGLPAEITRQRPSPDMMRGLTDEGAIGLSYRTLDIILDGVESGLPDEKLLARGLTRRQIALVREVNRLSSWKRGTNHTAFPVDGGAGGDLRVRRSPNPSLGQIGS